MKLRRLTLLGALAGALAISGTVQAQPKSILNASYDVTREFYADFNAAFTKSFKEKTGEDVAIDLSNAGSSKQARSVIDGLDADVVTMNQETDIDAIVAAGLIAPDWKKRFPDDSAPYSSTIVFLVRKGNPAKIQDWGDLARSGISIIVPNPKTSGNGRYSYLAAWAWAKAQPGGTDESATEFVTKLFRNVPILETGGRGATSTFLQKEIGDVLLTFESEALQIARTFSDGKFDVVYPSQSILADAPVSLVDKVVEKRGSRELATAYLQHLWSDEGQALAVKYFFRPKSKALLEANASTFPEIKLVKVDDVFGSWADAQNVHFADGGIFDKIYQPAASR